MQSDRIRDYVFPLFEVEQRPAELAVIRFLGTGFFIGSSCIALTAAHVLRSVTHSVAIVLVDERPSWQAYAAIAWEEHPEEDVCVVRVEPPVAQTAWRSIVRPAAIRALSSMPYHLWGYPEDAAYELVNDDRAGLRPDLVYSEGHVRRRITNVPLPQIRGSRFLELSAVAGGGCSGSPVLTRRPGDIWGLAGVYVGERTNDRATSVGYAVPVEDVGDWAPELVGRPLAKEVGDVTD